PDDTSVRASGLLSVPRSGRPALNLGVLSGWRRQERPGGGFLDPAPCLPRAEDPSPWLEHLEEGYAAMEAWMRRHPGRLAPHLRRMDGASFRYLYRRTETYARLVCDSLQP